MNLIDPEVMQRFAGSLLHFIWQGALIAIVAVAGLRLLRRRSPEARYAFAITALVCMLAAPVFTLAFYAQTGYVAQQLILALSRTTVEGSFTAGTPEASLWAERIILAWCAGFIVFAVRLVVGWRLSWQLVKSAQEILTPGVAKVFESVRERLGLRQPIRLLAHARLDSPMVVGWLRPVVLLPVSLITGFTTDQLTAILAHELAHIRRHDFIVNILQRCVESILFYHPAVWWLSKRIRVEREHCCDDIAVRLCGSRKVYAEALMELERARQPRPILAVAGADGIVLQRFRRVLGLNTSVADWQSAVGILLFLGIWIIVGMWQSSSTLQATPAVIAEPAAAPMAILPAIAAPASVAQSFNAIAAILTAQPPTPVVPLQGPAVAAPAGTTKGMIEGVVTRSGTTAPVPGARVAITNAPFDPDALKTLLDFWALRGVTMNPQQPGQSDEQYFQGLMDNIAAKGLSASLPENQIAIAQFRTRNTARYSAVADSNGRFTIKDVAPGQYSLMGEQQGFFDPPGNQLLAEVEAGKSANIVVPLLSGATLTGRVKNSAGKLLPNAIVTAHQITYLNGKIIPQARRQQPADDRGEYRMFWLPPGDYVVVADPPRYPVSGVPQQLEGVPIVAGPGNQPPPTVTLSTPQFMRTFYPQSLTTTDARIVAVKSGDELSGMDITVQKGATYRISGEIHAIPSTALAVPARGRGANPTPAAQQRIQGFLGLEFRDPSVVDMRSTNLGGTVPSAGNFFLTPTEDGFRATFEVRDVLPGEYYLVPRVNQSIPLGSGNFTINRIPVDVRDRDVTGLAIQLFAGVSVDGTLTVDGHAPGNVTARVALSAVGNPSPTYQGITVRAVIPKADDGTFTIANVPPTRYRVEMGAGLPPDLYIADVHVAGASVFDSGLDVGREPPGRLQVMLRSGAGIVEGVVRDGTGKAVPNATVAVIPPDARRENRALYKTGTSDAMGKFTVRGIAPGGYKVFAFQGIAGGEFYNSRFLSKYEFRGKSINVAQGSTVTESLTVIDSN